jgi:hypothetical protein
MRSRSLNSAFARLLYCVRWVARKMKDAMAARELSTDIRQMGQIADLRHSYAPRKSKSSRRQGRPPGGLAFPSAPRRKGCPPRGLSGKAGAEGATIAARATSAK